MLVSVRTANQSSLSEIISNWRPFRTIDTNRNIWFCTWWLAPWEPSKRLLSLCILNSLICFLHYLYSKYFLEETMPFWDSPANVCKFTKNTEWILSPRFTDPQSFKNVQEMQENKGGHLSFGLHLWFWFFLLLLCSTYFQCSALGLAYYRCFINADRMSNRVGGELMRILSRHENMSFLITILFLSSEHFKAWMLPTSVKQRKISSVTHGNL